MANVDLSHRVAKVKLASPFQELEYEELMYFLKAFKKADTFNDLPDKYQNLIIKAEQEKNNPNLDWTLKYLKQGGDQ